MISDSDLGTVLDISKNQDEYIRLSGNDQDIIELYKRFNKLYGEYYLSLQMEIGNRMSYSSALTTVKVDPYIAGGAAQGLAGIGAGIYAAGSVAERNQRIDDERVYLKQKVQESARLSGSKESQVVQLANIISSALNSIDKIKEYRETKWEADYKTASDLMKKTMNKEALVKARAIFLSMNGYKDSRGCAKRCEELRDGIKQKICLIVSTVMAVIMILIGVAAPNMGGYALPLGLFTFGISYISCLLFVKNE